MVQFGGAVGSRKQDVGAIVLAYAAAVGNGSQIGIGNGVENGKLDKAAAPATFVRSMVILLRYVQVPYQEPLVPACVTVKVWPAMVMAPVRELVFASVLSYEPVRHSKKDC